MCDKRVKDKRVSKNEGKGTQDGGKASSFVCWRWHTKVKVVRLRKSLQTIEGRWRMIHAGNPHMQILTDKQAVTLTDATAAVDSDPAERGDFVYLTKAAFQIHISPRCLFCCTTSDMTLGFDWRLRLYNRTVEGEAEGACHILKEHKHPRRSGDPEMQTNQPGQGSDCSLSPCVFIQVPIYIFVKENNTTYMNISYPFIYAASYSLHGNMYPFKKISGLFYLPWDYHKSDSKRNSECPIMNAIG